MRSNSFSIPLDVAALEARKITPQLHTESVMFAVYITACGFTAAITPQLLYTDSVMFAVYI